MSKISKIWTTKENIWYDELKVIAPYREYQYDRTIQSKIQIIFDDYFAVAYGKTIRHREKDEKSRPDFSLIRKDYGEWWIVEVERIEDNIRHARKQIDDFVNGDYNFYEESKHLKRRNPNLDIDRLQEVTKNIPQVMVIVDDINSEWIKKLEDLKPLICIFKVYRNKKGLDLHHISGDYPYIFERESHCRFTEPMQNLLLVSNPEVLDTKNNPKSYHKSILEKIFKPVTNILKHPKNGDEDSFMIIYKGKKSKWKKIVDSDKVYLQPVDYNIPRVNDNYILKRTNKKKLILELC